jgi:hypothetical protein
MIKPSTDTEQQILKGRTNKIHNILMKILQPFFRLNTF